jgi:CubicO group peptidase (beta-lactamase class C family)
MSCRGIVFGALAALAAWPAVLPAQQSFAIPEDAQASVRARVDNGYTVGVVVGVVDSAGTRYFAYGWPTRGSAVPVNDRTVFEIGSVTKVFTALALADMVVRGEVGLDDPVQGYLPDTVHVPRGATTEITLRLLASQRSGLPRMPSNFAPANGADPFADYDTTRLFAYLGGATLSHQPGGAYEYSNLGFGLLGVALARRSGTSYEDLLRRRILAPLGLTSTMITLSSDSRARLATGHDGDRRVAGWTFGALEGAGALHSCAADMLRFLAEEMGLVDSPLREAMRLTQQPLADVAPTLKIALAWHITTHDSTTIVWHNGQTGGYHSFVAFDPVRRRGVVVLANSGENIDDVGLHILDPGIPLAQIRTAVRLPAESLEAYVGRYALAPGIVMTVTREGDALLAQLTGQGAARIYASVPDEFFYRVVNAQLTFRRSPDGAVESLVLHQNGRDVPATRNR